MLADSILTQASKLEAGVATAASALDPATQVWEVGSEGMDEVQEMFEELRVHELPDLLNVENEGDTFEVEAELMEEHGGDSHGHLHLSDRVNLAWPVLTNLLSDRPVVEGSSQLSMVVNTMSKPDKTRTFDFSTVKL